jgi:hypothetical protein
MKPLSRRTVLQGLGTAFALPWLEAFRPRAARAGEAASPTTAPSAPPRRLAFLFVPNGMVMEDFTPREEGSAFDLPAILEPLAPVRDDVLVLSGLTHDKARPHGDGPGDHARAAACFLTASQPRKTSGADLHVGVSIDQVAARDVGRATRFPSLELGCDPARQSGSCDSGYSCAYSSSIAWSTPHTPLGKEVNPRLAFERLFAFGDPATSRRVREERRLTRRSVLDYVREDAQRLEGRLGATDREKLDEYLTAVRALETRLARSERAGKGESPLEGVEMPAGIPKDHRDHVRLMNDLIVLAFRADLTRVVTFMVANAGSNESYPYLGVKGGHHELSHHGGDKEKIAGLRTIDRFNVSQLSYLLQALKGVKEGEGTLLDSCMVLFGSGIADGNRHNHDHLPILLAGRGGGTITPGRHVRHPDETPCANLFLSLLDRMGVSRTSFGDSTGRLEGLQT